MYLHVGNNKNIRIKDIIGIFDADTATISSVRKKYLTAAEREKLVLSAKDEIPKSFILYRENGKFMICFSQISTSALCGRI
jgi:UDP-N-acetylmuramyl pentapeptide synthase